MQWMEAKVTFSSGDEALSAELISSLFQDLDIAGVVVDDPHLEPIEGWGDDAVPLPSEPAITGYLAADQRLEKRCLDLEQALSDLAARQPLHYNIKYQRLDEEDWAESWKDFFFPEQITPTMVVKPTWRDHTPEPGQQVIEIDPGMAFGTGTHPTTALCIELLEKKVRSGQEILDVGTGSGILLIAAAKLGATQLTGVDLDPVAVEVAEANLRLNGIPEDQFNLSCGNLTETVEGVFDGVVANILADVIVDLLDHLARLLKPGGWLICSGIIQAYQDRVARKMAARGFRVEEVLERGDWVALAGRLENSE